MIGQYLLDLKNGKLTQVKRSIVQDFKNIFIPNHRTCDYQFAAQHEKHLRLLFPSSAPRTISPSCDATASRSSPRFIIKTKRLDGDKKDNIAIEFRGRIARRAQQSNKSSGSASSAPTRQCCKTSIHTRTRSSISLQLRTELANIKHSEEPTAKIAT